MPSRRTAGFRKQRTCPPSETLLRHREAATAGAARRKIMAHLAACDFCGAEMQLLTKHPPHACAAAFTPCEIPQPLRRLAEELMSAPEFVRARFAEAVYEIERLTLTDA